MHDTASTLNGYTPTDYDKRMNAIHIANGDVTKAREIYAFLNEVRDTPQAPAADAKPKDNPPKAAKAEAKAAPKAEEPKAEPAKTGGVPDYVTQVVPAITKTVARIDTASGTPGTGKEKVRGLLGAFGVDHASRIPAEKLAEFVAQLDTLEA